MDKSTGSPPHEEGHYTHHPRYSEKFLLPSSVLRNTLRASNLNTAQRFAMRQSVVQTGGESDLGRDPGPTVVLQTRSLAAEPESPVDRRSQVRVVTL